jgi:NADH:ubiquinone oxidoreductase subunit 2 (subunit N)
VTLLALLLVGGLGALGSGLSLPRGGRAAQLGAIGGTVALALVALLAVATPIPDVVAADASGAVPGTLWNGALVPSDYVRAVVVLWAAASVIVVGVAWLLGGVNGLRGVLPASLAAIVGAAVTLSASSAALGVAAAAATGLASVPAVLATSRLAAAGVAAREVRIAIATAAVVLAVAAASPVLSRLVLANPDGPEAQPGSGVAVAVAFGLLAIAVVVAARVGAIPYHVRISALTDVVPTGSMPLVAAWLPLPLAVVALGVISDVLAPLALPVGGAQAVIVAFTLAATLAAALVAYLQDDLRHAVGYLTIADLGLVLLGVAALDPAAWGSARMWLLSVAVTKTALACWAIVVEHRFETRSVPDLRGWLRPAPVLGAALALTVLATFGLPGWAVLTARGSLVSTAAGGPWDMLLLVASFLTLPAYLRWFTLGIGSPTSHVDRVVPELGGLRGQSRRVRRSTAPSPLRWRGRAAAALPVEQEGEAVAGRAPATPGPATAGPSADGHGPHASGAAIDGEQATRRHGGPALATTAPAGPEPDQPDELTPPAPRRPRVGARPSSRAAMTEVRRHRAGLLSTAVVALALLATLVAAGAFDLERAASAPAPGAAQTSLVGD